MSRHEGVSCDACLRSNFRGRRYKCLVCYDYDLCASCHEAGATTTRHAAEHPMQCILTRSDFELYFSGEAISSEQPQSFVCPHCGKMGLTELTLADHVTAQHADATTQVVCPVCASVPNGEPNHVTEDLTAHLSVDHGRTGSASSGSGAGGRDLISFGEEPGSGSRQAARRVPHPSRSVGGPRMRRFNMHFRESMDPITELLSQLSGVRRAGGSTSASSSSSAASAAANAASEAASSAGASSAALQQLQMHLQLERQQYAQVVRQQTERTPRRQAEVSGGGGGSGGGQQGAPGSAPASTAAVSVAGTGAGKPLSAAETAEATSQFLLCRIRDEEDADVDMARRRRDRADRAIFAQEIVLSTLSKSLEECAAMSEAGAAVAAASSSPSGSNSPSQPGAEAGAARSAATAAGAAAPPNGAKPAAVSAPAAGATAAPPVAPRQVGAAARSAAAAVSVGGVINGAGRGARGGGVRGLVGVPTAAVSQLGPRVVPVRGRRKPARPAAAGPLDGRGGAMPAADPPPPH